MRHVLILVVAAAGLAFAGVAYGAGASCPFDSLQINTGWDQDAQLKIPTGQQDTEWTIYSVSGTDSWVVEPFDWDNMAPHNWADSEPNSQWICPRQRAQREASGYYLFVYWFCLEDPTAASLDMWVRADNRAAVHLNGTYIESVSDGTLGPGSYMAPISAVAPFRMGWNYICVEVENYGGPVGLEVVGSIHGVPKDDCYVCPQDQRPEVLIVPQLVTGTINRTITITPSVAQAITPRPNLWIETECCIPPGAQFTDNHDGTWIFHWVPGPSQLGTFPVTFTASDSTGWTTSATSVIEVLGAGRPPAFDAVGDQVVNEGSVLAVPLHAYDPDREDIVLTASLPQFATLDAPASGDGSVLTTITAAPGYGSAGTYPVSVTATSAGESAQLSFSVAVRATGVSSPIIAVAPLSHDFGAVNIGAIASFAYTVSNTGIADLHIAGVAVSNPQYAASFGTMMVPPGGSTLMTVTFTPGSGGPSSATITVQSDATNGDYVLNAMGRGNTPPVLAFDIPSPGTAYAYVPFALQVSATDAEGNAVTFTVSPLPVGATFDVGSGLFSWTPGPADGGGYNLTFCATDDVATACEPYTLVVIAGNNPPVANPGGPYSGGVGQAIQFDGSGSSDPDGDNLFYNWNFGDGAAGTSMMPVHSYALAKTYLVTLVVTDNGTPPLSASATTSATVVPVVTAQVQFKTTNGKVKTFGGGTQLVGLEPAGRPATEIVPSSVKMTATVCPTGEIMAIAKGATVGDMDGDGIPDLDVNFTRGDLGLLLGCLPNGSLVTVSLTAATTGGLPVAGSATIKVATRGGGAVLSVAAVPNPFNPVTSISYSLRDDGDVSVRIYSSTGRIIRTLEERHAVRGTHEVRWTGVDDEGRAVNSGVYFVAVESRGERLVEKLLLLK